MPRFRTFWFIFGCLLLSGGGNTLFARLDSLRNQLEKVSGNERHQTLDELCWVYGTLKPDSAIYFGRIMLHEAGRRGDSTQQVQALVGLSRGFERSGMMDSARHYIFRGTSLCLKMNDSLGVAKTLNQGGSIERKRGEFEVAMDAYLKSLEIARALEEKYLEAIVSVNLAGLYSSMGNQQAAQNVLEEALPLVIELKQPYLEASVYSMLSATQTANMDTAIYLAGKSAALYLEMGLFDDYVSVLNNQGSYYLKKGDYEEGYKVLKRAYEIRDSLGNWEGFPMLMANFGRAQVYMGETREGLARQRRALSLAREGDRLDEMKLLYQGLSQAYQYINQVDSAMYFFDLQQDIADSLANIEVRLALEDLEKRYKSEQQAREIAEWEERNAKKQKTEGFLWAAITFMGIVLLLGGVLVWLWIKQRQLVEEEKARDLERRTLRAQMNPHFIFNSLNAVQMLFMRKDFVRANEYLGDFGQLLRNILEHSMHRHITLEEELATLSLYLSVEQIRLGKNLEFTLDIGQELEADEIQVPSLILQPFVENAIWHGIAPKNAPGHILIKVRETRPNLLTCTILDDGVGLDHSPKTRQHRSRGLQITRERLGKKGGFSMKTRKGDKGEVLGTTVVVQIPIGIEKS